MNMIHSDDSHNLSYLCSRHYLEIPSFFQPLPNTYDLLFCFCHTEFNEADYVTMSLELLEPDGLARGYISRHRLAPLTESVSS